MDLDGRYVSLLDSLSSYCFTPLEELQDWAKDLSVARPVRVIGKFCETNDGVMLAQDNVQVQCNFKQMRHKFLMNFSEYFECLGEYNGGVLYPHIVMTAAGVNIKMYKEISKLVYFSRL
eukprot:TRINITY_DN14042_c0_g1_i3.p1 TRINITY_DN14042_c0_g1~~TRINITY_DN14042_c0_g1_i3.p1  ORF type:complete len:119 (+),score=22.11 TRINITY_DN14042_c0_g1_i3:121-477(+)